MKYRRIIAGLLTINMMASSILTGGVSVSASNGSPVTKSAVTTESELTSSTGETTGDKKNETSDTDKKDTDDNTKENTDKDTTSDKNTASDKEQTSDTSDVSSDIKEDTNTEDKTDADTSVDTDTSKNTDSADGSTEDSAQSSVSDASETEETESSVVEEENADEEVQVQIAAADLKVENFAFYDAEKKLATVASPAQLILLSNCNQKDLQDITIELTTTGGFDLTTTIASGTDISSFFKTETTSGSDQSGSTDGTANGADQSATTETKVVADQEYTYQGIGDADHPFQGTITGQTPVITANTTIFGGLSSKATVDRAFSVTWSGDGTTPMLAGVYVLEGGNDSTGTKTHSMPTIKFSNGMGSLIGTVKASDGHTDEILKIDSAVVTYADEVTVGSSTSTENAGLICNTLESGIVELDEYTAPQKITVKTDSGSAGSLIGKIDKGTLKITSLTTTTLSDVTIASSSGNAGGIVGELTEDATVASNVAVTLENPTVSGANAGGFVGKATNVNYTGTNTITVKNPSVSGNVNKDANAGGFAGDYAAMAKDDTTASQQLPENIVIETPKVTVNGTLAADGGNAGGYFGLLEMQGNLIFSVSGDTDTKKEITTEFTSGSGGSYGAIAGKVTTTDKTATLQITNIQVNSTKADNTYYHGGLIGNLGEKVYLQVQNADVTISAPTANYNRGFGGIVGHLSENSVLKLEDVKVSASTGTINGGGGLVGCMASGSILEVSGETDLSSVNYTASQYTGQLVGEQDCALVYAKGDGNGNGWKYIRSNFTSGSSYINDIGNYGEILRLKADEATTGLDEKKLFALDSTHEIKYNSTLSLSGIEIMIGSAEDFALLSLAWNSHGVFSPDTALNNSSWGDLKSKNITFTSDVDLTGTGVIGISRDSEEEDYTGTITGGDYTVTLAIGEAFGYAGDILATKGQNGCGKLYAVDKNHKYLGLFASAKESIKNLKIAGYINGSNGIGAISIGSIAAKKNGTNGTFLNTVEVSTNIVLDANGNNFSCVGGLYGEGYGESICLEKNVKEQTTIEVHGCNNDNDVRTYVGGVVGYVSGTFKIKCNGIEIGGSISTDAPRYAYVGGVIGFMEPANNATSAPSKWIEIRNIVFDKFKIVADNASVACGGLLGSIWSGTGVYFMGDTDDTDTIDKQNATKMTVTDASINAPNASVGGLAYRASGIWEIRTDGIDIQKMTINCGKDLGLLVCHGEKGTVLKDKELTDGALYLRTTKEWTNAYKIAEDLDIQSGNSAVFDELVAYTAASAGRISENGENGIVSLATKDRVGVAEESNNCTTYQNRTNYGKKHKTNGCSRYYYDLDQYTIKASSDSANNNGTLDTQEELLLWSCYKYACANIKGFFDGKDLGNSINVPDVNKAVEIRGDLDMKKYSYYPINLDTGITINDAKITFYNQEIESAETTASNKSTKQTTSGTNTVQTQHYMMHCGLFLNHTAGTASTEISLNDVTFAGSIGKINAESSGALFAGTISGNEVNGKQYTAKVNLKKITLDGLKITDYTDKEYAPLLINQLGSYTNTEVTDVKTKSYTDGTAVASSLFGNAGSSDGHQINMSFSDIILPDKKADSDKKEGIFTHATLLESYKYADDDSSVATYNFYKSGDWDGSVYNHQVTYGKEISETKEYIDLQKWYYDKATYGKTEGEVVSEGDNKNFSEWLPYVCVSYNENTQNHEIKVNQRVYDIVTGCGTYGDPYVITYAEELEIISEYMITHMPRRDWKITVTKDQTDYHTSADKKEDITFQYNGSEWEEVENKSTDVNEEKWETVTDGETRTDLFMQRYIANAYYDLQGTGQNATIELKNFNGLGTADNPFRGVLSSTKGVTLELSGADTGNGLIPYSYGSVVKDLTIKYTGDGKTLTYKKSASPYYPTSCFGGVIGCILGGDNIIDKVDVRYDANWLKLDGTNKHLLQVGGYVGSICGGGVLFRNMNGATALSAGVFGGSAAEAEYSSLYVNPYVGRVLDGYAFDVTEGDTLNNTDKNYQIQNLSSVSANRLTMSNGTVTIVDAEGLLLLSAIVNSGAASSGKSNAYYGTAETGYDDYKVAFGNGLYGKVRKATYAYIGKTETEAENDFKLSVNDDAKAPGTSNTPYLISAYATGGLFNLATVTGKGTTGGASFVFVKNAALDMSSYRMSYQGISARYVANAVTSGATGTSAAGVVPLVKNVTGNDASISLDIFVREYADDDFHAASIGGLFNLFSPLKPSSISDIALMSKDASKGVILQYYTENGAETAVASSEWAFKSNVGVGSLIGSSSGAMASDSWYQAAVAFEDIKAENMTVQGPAAAGGLIGNMGRMAPLNRGGKTDAKDIAILIQPYAGGNGQQTAYIDGRFKNCSYQNLIVTGQEAAGGICAYIDGQIDLLNDFKVTDASVIVGSASTITAVLDTSVAGGLFGFVRRGFTVNTTSETHTAKWQDVDVSAGRYSGGLVGQMLADRNTNLVSYTIKKVEIDSTMQTKHTVKTTAPSGATYVGGIVGSVSSLNKNMTIADCKFTNMQINESTNGSETNDDRMRSGGIVGQTAGSAQVNVENCTVISSDIYGSRSGGIAGESLTNITFTQCAVQGETTDKNKIDGRRCAGGIIGSIGASLTIGMHENIVQNAEICCGNSNKDWGAGGLTGDIDGKAAPNTYVYDSSVEDCTVTGYIAGGVFGNMRGKLSGSNLLLKETTINAVTANNVGLLMGQTGTNLKPMTVAGISIQSTVATYNGTQTVTKLYSIINNSNTSEAVKKQSYFSFADYNGTAAKAQTTLMGKEKTKYPYVVTSPESNLKVWQYKPGGTEEAQSLYGDAATWEKSENGYTVTAQNICADAAASAHAGKYTYQETGVDNFRFAANFSTYNDNQESKLADEDNFPVLQLTDNVTDTITDYVNILTNGGFSRANEITDATGHVDASVSTYQYDAETKAFVLAGKTAKPALEVKHDADNRISEFATTTAYDNTQNRFTLLTVTFTETDESNVAHTYNVLIPIIVRRMLEIDFTATLSSGTNYRASSYDAIEDNAHLLESVGNAFTAYLTYTYNSANGTYSEFGWDSYIKAGGNVTASGLERKLEFSGAALPAGTQLSLVDCRNGSKVYYYTMQSADSTNNKSLVSFNQFKDAEGNAYGPESIGELMGVRVTPDDAGTFIKVDKDGKPVEETPTDTEESYNAPTVRIKTSTGYEYYRLKQAGEDYNTYAVSVNETDLVDAINNKSKVSQNYYLVITVPEIEGTVLNGSIQTEVSGEIPHRVNYLTRKGKVEDNHSNTASTYQISQGYQQDLKENTEKIVGVVKKLSADDSVMNVDVVDEIMIPADQAFQEQDELYQKFNGGLIKTLESSTPTETSSEVFPDGTSGTATFYVYTISGTDKTYYTYENGTLKKVGATEQKALEYLWSAVDGKMDLPFSTDGTAEHAVSLKQVRSDVKGNQNKFYVEVRMSVKLGSLQVIPESKIETGKTTPTDYTKLSYTSQLATSTKSLSYSTARGLLQDTRVCYYREDPMGATLEYNADEISQLGINLLDLQQTYLDTSGENTWIDTWAKYNVKDIKNLASTLGKSKGIRFTLQLQNKDQITGNLEDYAAALDNLSSYISVEVQSENSGSATLTDDGKAYTWTVLQKNYWDTDKNQLKTSSIFDGEELKQSIQLKVNISNVEKLLHVYANYRVVLTAEIIDNDEKVVTNSGASDNIIYTLAKINTEFVK